MLNEFYARLFTLAARIRDEKGQGMVEYALILVLVSIAAIAVLPGLGTAVSQVFTDITGAL